MKSFSLILKPGKEKLEIVGALAKRMIQKSGLPINDRTDF